MTLNTVTGRLESGPTQIVRLTAKLARIEAAIDDILRGHLRRRADFVKALAKVREDIRSS